MTMKTKGGERRARRGGAGGARDAACDGRLCSRPGRSACCSPSEHCSSASRSFTHAPIGVERRCRKLAVAEARKTLPGLQIGAIGGDDVHDLALRDVDVRDDRGQPAVHVDRISARFCLAALLHRTVSVSELRIEGVAITARPDERGGVQPLSSHRLLRRPPKPRQPASGEQAAPSAWRVHVDGSWSPASRAASRCPMAARGRSGTCASTVAFGSIATRFRPTSTRPSRRCSSRACVPEGVPIDLHASVAGPREHMDALVEIDARCGRRSPPRRQRRPRHGRTGRQHLWVPTSWRSRSPASTPPASSRARRPDRSAFGSGPRVEGSSRRPARAPRSSSTFSPPGCPASRSRRLASPPLSKVIGGRSRGRSHCGRKAHR